MDLKDYEELTVGEYNQLKVFGKLKQYKDLKTNEFSFDKGYSKNDILWTIYNEQKDTYILKKDYVMAGVVFNRMHELLYKEKKYIESLHFLLCYAYIITFGHFDYISKNSLNIDISNLNLLSNRLMKDFEYIKEKINQINKNCDFVLDREIVTAVSTYLRNFYNENNIIFLKKYLH